MRKVRSRGVALAVLQEWRRGKAFANALLDQHLRITNLGAPDRAFVTELCYGVLRNLLLLDFWIDRLRSGRLDNDSRDLLRLGLYQLFVLHTAEHAAIYETVELAHRKNRALVNGVLRNAIRRRTALVRDADAQPLSVRKSHPQFLIDRWIKNFGEQETEALCTWNNRPAPIYARVNRLKISDDDFLSQLGLDGCADRIARSPDRLPADFFRLTNVPSQHLAAGHCYIQDPSTATACLLLNPQPGERILDACAAPGGKTGFVAALMKNRGSVLACDRDRGRVKTLRDNLERLGAIIVQTMTHHWANQLIEDPQPFDRILVDVPCSNTGVIQRRADVRWRLTPDDFPRMAAEQFRIVQAVLPFLKPGGVLVYSTCSVEPEENGEVVARILAKFPFLKLIEEKSILPFLDGFDGAYAAKLRATGS